VDKKAKARTEKNNRRGKTGKTQTISWWPRIKSCWRWVSPPMGKISIAGAVCWFIQTSNQPDDATFSVDWAKPTWIYRVIRSPIRTTHHMLNVLSCTSSRRCRRNYHLRTVCGP
jgi:hypothetical protein